MIKIPGDKPLYVDVDNTLIMWTDDGFTWKPHTRHIQKIKQFHARGQTVIVWSAGGVEWAEKAVRLLGIKKYVTAVMAKPAWWIDDLSAEDLLPKINHIYVPFK